MVRKKLWKVITNFGILGFCIIMSNPVLAQSFGGGFESKVQNLTDKLITVILPLFSVLGLVYAVFLALTGDGGAKGRIIMVIVCSILGFTAPYLVSWIQSATGH